MIARLTGCQGIVEWDVSKPNGQPRRKLDINRARAAFGFESSTPFAVGLARTIEWYGAAEAAHVTQEAAHS
jgi:nucleoside-diphosphate-sugar epimerase